MMRTGAVDVVRFRQVEKGLRVTVNWLHALPPQQGEGVIVVTQKLRGALVAVFEGDDVRTVAATQPSRLLSKMRWAIGLCGDEDALESSREQLTGLAGWVTDYLGGLLTMQENPPSDRSISKFAIDHGLNRLVKTPESRGQILRGEVLLSDPRTGVPLNPVLVRLVLLRIEAEC